MNLLRLNLKSNFLYTFILLVSFFIFVYLNQSQFFQKFDSQVVLNYQRSQDILDTGNKIKDRIFISDSDIYIASGYLYITGTDPRDFNFQHPPFVKYLFGISSKYFNMPLLPNLFFAFVLVLEVYLLGKLAFKSELIGLLSSLLLMFDPVFKEVSTYALLDIGQVVFLLGFLITTLYYKKHYIGQGILLGLAMASKFYSPVFIILGLVYLYKLLNKNFELKTEIRMLFFAFLTFCFSYVISFINDGFTFNIFLHQAKIIKFMIDHNRAQEWGSVVKMFLGGYFVWPLLFFISLYQMFKLKFNTISFWLCLIPVFYFLVMVFQLPFTRYFILILPFMYLSLINFVLDTNNGKSTR